MSCKNTLQVIVLAMVLALGFSFHAGAAEYSWRMQHSWGAAENHHFENFAKVVNEMSGGRIEIKVFADGELVDVEKIMDAVAAGTIDIGHTHPDYQMGSVPVGELEGAPFLWDNMEQEFAHIFRYGIADIYTEAFEKRYKISVLGFQLCDKGTLAFTKEVNSLEDMKGMNINVQDPYATFLHELVGASSVYMGAEELYTSLSRNVLQGVEYGGAKAMYDMSLPEVTKSFLLPYHQVAWAPFYFINKNKFEKLPDDLKAILKKAVDVNTIYMMAFYAEKEQEALRLMQEKHGMKVTHLPENDVKILRQKTIEWLTNDFAKKDPYCKKAADATLKALKDFGRL